MLNIRVIIDALFEYVAQHFSVVSLAHLNVGSAIESEITGAGRHLAV